MHQISSLKMNTTCNICCELFTTKRRAIICPYCDDIACRECREKYILSQMTPKCMNGECGKEWTRHYMSQHFTASFMKTKFKTHLENILFEKQKALLPESQAIIEREKEKKQISNVINEKMKEINIQIEKMEQIIHQLKRQKLQISDEKRELFRKMDGDTNVKERAKFIQKCSDPNCRGYLSTQWKCGLCEKWTCSHCHEIKGITHDAEHTCNPDLVETVKLLKKDSRPCPACQCMIYKISGCNQMWCTQCHVAFDWISRKIEKNVHNPHYYEWMSNQQWRGS